MAEARIITAGYRVDVEKLLPVTALNSARLAACARGLREVVEPNRVTGSDRLVLKVVAQSVDHLDEIIQRLGRFGTPTVSIVLSSRRQPVSRVSEQDSHRGSEQQAAKRR
jgi:Lrp/AsnC family leucine-responsive transcriptional regulator